MTFHNTVDRKLKSDSGVKLQYSHRAKLAGLVTHLSPVTFRDAKKGNITAYLTINSR